MMTLVISLVGKFFDKCNYMKEGHRFVFSSLVTVKTIDILKLIVVFRRHVAYSFIMYLVYICY